MLTEETINKVLEDNIFIQSNETPNASKTFKVSFKGEFIIEHNNKLVSVITDKLVAIETYNNIKL